MLRGAIVYISGPLTGPTLLANVHRAVAVAERLRRAGFVPVVPHLAALWEMILPGASYEDWMALDLTLVERCDALLRIPGESRGADQESEHARAHGIPVFVDENALLADARYPTARRSATATATRPRLASNSLTSLRNLVATPAGDARAVTIGRRSPTEGYERSATYADPRRGPSLALPQDMTAAVTAMLVDLRDLEAMLHLLGDAVERRGDEDTRRALRLLARLAERLGEQLENLLASCGPCKETSR